MAATEERHDFHVRVEADRLETLDALIREFRPSVIRVGQVPDGKAYALDALVTSEVKARLEAAGHRLSVIARVNQPEDLRREVSQTDRFKAELDRLKGR